MRRAAIRFVAGIMLTSGIALAQVAEDTTTQLGDCSPTERAERLECPQKAPRTTAPGPALKENIWTISLTTSPVDYSPVATATTSSRDGGAGESPIKLSIRCRGGRTELLLAGPGISGRGDYAIFYRVNDGQPVQAAVRASGAGVTLGGDVVRLLQSLPDGGSLSIHLLPRSGASMDGSFSLVGLETVRAKMVDVCRWPHPVAKPNR
jgi:hypothetical protein